MKRQLSLAGSLEGAVGRLSALSFGNTGTNRCGTVTIPFIFGRRINGPASIIFEDILLGRGMNGKTERRAHHISDSCCLD